MSPEIELHLSFIDKAMLLMTYQIQQILNSLFFLIINHNIQLFEPNF